MRYVEVQVRVREPPRECRLAVCAVLELDRFRAHTQPHGEQLAQVCPREDESAGVAIEGKTPRPVALGVREQRRRRANGFGRGRQTRHHDLDGGPRYRFTNHWCAQLVPSTCGYRRSSHEWRRLSACCASATSGGAVVATVGGAALAPMAYVTFVQPVTGFHVASVHSIPVLRPIADLRNEAIAATEDMPKLRASIEKSKRRGRRSSVSAIRQSDSQFNDVLLPPRERKRMCPGVLDSPKVPVGIRQPRRK